MEINVAKTIIMPQEAGPILKIEDIAAVCHWQTLLWQEEILQTEGVLDLCLDYTCIPQGDNASLSQSELISALEGMIAEPEGRASFTMSIPLAMTEPICCCKADSLQLKNCEYSLISPYVIELQLCFEVEELKDSIIDRIECEETAEDIAEEKAECAEAEERLTEESEEKIEKPAEYIVAENICEEVKTCCKPRFTVSGEKKMRERQHRGGYSMRFYRVREGDSLWSIAEKMQVAASMISQLNQLPDGEVRVDMLLNIPHCE